MVCETVRERAAHAHHYIVGTKMRADKGQRDASKLNHGTH